MGQTLDSLNAIAGNAWMYGGTFLLVLSVLVFVHEWGHYIVARLCGVRIETFSIGFGREIFGRTDRHGTRWKFSLIPLGGYVKMFGDTDPASTGKAESVALEDGSSRPLTTQERGQAFFAKPVWQRALIVFAGPAINFLFAILVLGFLFMSYGQPVAPPVAAGIKVGSAAERAGFVPGDRVLSANGQAFRSFDDVRRFVMLALDTPATYQVERAGETITIEASADRLSEEDRFGFSHEKGVLGLIGPANGFDYKRIISVDDVSTQDDPARARREIESRFGQTVRISVAPYKEGAEPEGFVIVPSAKLEESENTKDLLRLTDQREEILHYGPLAAFGRATTESWSIAVDTLRAFGQIITGVRSATELGGVIRIGAVAGDMAHQGWIALLTFTAILSINLGLINLFPVPMLDGGHLVFYAAEAVRGAPIPDRIQEYAFRVGFALLIALMLFANLNDLVQIIS